MSAAVEEQAKELANQQNQQLQLQQQNLQTIPGEMQQNQIQIGNHQMRYQIQQTKNAANQNNHFRHAQHSTNLVPPQPS